MKLKVLEDNNTFIDEYYLGEPAVSYYIEDGDTKILFDTGYSDAFIKNAKSMNIDLSKIQKLVISHGHNDHTGGIKFLFEEVNGKGIDLIAHPECFNNKISEDGYIGTSMKQEQLEKVCNLKLTKSPTKISENIIFLGEIPDINSFEKRIPIGECENNGEMIDDLVIEDSAMVYKSSDGLFIITGCSHAGICNIIEYAKKVCKDDRILGVIGGFHLLKVNERLYNTIEFLEKNSIKLLYPAHCISLEAKIEMGKKLKINEVGVGLEINLEN